MVKYKMIVAMCGNNGIGYKNSLPWSNSEDLKRFANLTKGNGKNAIIMGSKTWESLPHKPLKERYNIVISKSSSIYLGDKMFSNIDNVYDFCEKSKFEDIWIIGGESIYRYFISKHYISEIHITKIPGNFECDTFFPETNHSNIIYY